MKPVPLREATDVGRFGGKAAQLAAALRAGLPVPDGFALSVELVDAIARGESAMLGAIEESGPGRWAVRSSAVGEDSSAASFAGQHASLLNVAAAGLREAVIEVWQSGKNEAAEAYRERLDIEGPVRMAVVVQQMVNAEVAGVLFTRNPVTGAHERLVEASWGLGEAVVIGMVTPDSFRIAADGRILERTAGHKDVEVRYRADGGGTEEVPVDAPRVEALCLDDARLQELHTLASRCDATFAGDHDIEWAFADGRLFLLQRRGITT